LSGSSKTLSVTLVDRKVGDLVVEGWGDIFEYGYNFGHESADTLVIFAVKVR
jgi:hypothetical protein